MAFAKNCEKSGEWAPREGRRWADKRLGHEQGQAENARLRSSESWRRPRSGEGTENGTAIGRLVFYKHLLGLARRMVGGDSGRKPWGCHPLGLFLPLPSLHA